MNAMLVAHLRREINKSLNGHDANIEFDILDEFDEAFSCISDEVLSEIESIARQFIASLARGLSHAERVCAVYYALVNECVYGISEMRFERIALNSLKKHMEVAKSHAILTHTLLRALDIPNQIVSGNLNNEKHFWNLVQVNQKWYHLDATWSKSPSEFIKYPLVSDEILGVTHHWNIERNHSVEIIEDCPSTIMCNGYNNNQNTKRDYS